MHPRRAGGWAAPSCSSFPGSATEGQLAEHGIRAIRHLPGVGENFQDHVTASVYGQTRHPISLLGADRGIQAARHGLQYLMWRTGLLSSNIIESGGFVDTSGGGRPDIQIHVTPRLVGDFDREPPPGHGITINPCILRPSSRGTVKLRSADPRDPSPARRQQSHHARGRRDDRARPRALAPHPARAGVGRLDRTRDTAVARRADLGCGPRASRPDGRQDGLPPVLHLQDGQGRHGRRRSDATRSRRAATAGSPTSR